MVLKVLGSNPLGANFDFGIFWDFLVWTLRVLTIGRDDRHCLREIDSCRKPQIIDVVPLYTQCPKVNQIRDLPIESWENPSNNKKPTRRPRTFSPENVDCFRRWRRRRRRRRRRRWFCRNPPIFFLTRKLRNDDRRGNSFATFPTDNTASFGRGGLTSADAAWTSAY